MTPAQTLKQNKERFEQMKAKARAIYIREGIEAKRQAIRARVMQKTWTGHMADPSKRLTRRINSSGGFVFEANSIYDDIKAFPGQTIGVVESNALSAASYILAACDERHIRRSGCLMIHEPYTIEDPMETDQRLTTKLRTTLLNAYQKVCKASRGYLSSLMDSETFLNADEAGGRFGDGLPG